MGVVVRADGDSIYAVTPFHPEFPGRAKMIGGRWVAGEKAWQFDGRDEGLVRALCMDIFGDDGQVTEFMSVRCTAVYEGVERREGIYLAGRLVAKATGRDSGARLGDGVVLLSGFFGSGGSVKNWRTYCKQGTVFEIRDLPVPAAMELLNSPPAWLMVVAISAVARVGADEEASVVDETPTQVPPVTSPAPAVIDRRALVVEREKLVARIMEIDRALFLSV